MKVTVSILLLSASISTAASSKDPGLYAIEGVNVIPMTSETVLLDRTVVVKDGRVFNICTRKPGCTPKDAEVILAEGKFLIPGLADMHTHIDTEDDFKDIPDPKAKEDRVIDQFLRQYLTFGVTTIREAAGKRDILKVREEIKAGKRAGPRLFTSYLQMDGDPKLHSGSTAFTSASAAADFVRETRAAGYDMVKVYSTLKPEIFSAIMTTAKDVGIPVMGHVPVQVDVEDAIKAGMRSLEHFSGYDVACAKGEKQIGLDLSEVYQGWAYCTPEKIKTLAEMTARYKNVWVVPTLLVVEHVKTDYHRYADDETVANAFTPAPYRLFYDYYYGIFPAIARAGLSGTRDTRLALVREFHKAGVPLLVGTDTRDAGYNVQQELSLFVEAGLKPYDALYAATAEPARYFEAEGKFGTIVAGASADLVLLAANPLEDITNVRKISGVMVRGEWWSKKRLEDERQALSQAYEADMKAH